MYRRNEAEFKGILFNGPDLYSGVSSNLCNGEKENRSVSVFVSEIGPDFSPDIKGHPKMGFSPWDLPSFLPAPCPFKREHIPGAKAHFVAGLECPG
jgi:hypothetical protein